jgi:hypothetical protein
MAKLNCSSSGSERLSGRFYRGMPPGTFAAVRSLLVYSYGLKRELKQKPPFFSPQQFLETDT